MLPAWADVSRNDWMRPRRNQVPHGRNLYSQTHAGIFHSASFSECPEAEVLWSRESGLQVSFEIVPSDSSQSPAARKIQLYPFITFVIILLLL